MLKLLPTPGLSDDDRIEAWVREQYPDILRYCLFHTVSRSEAEDATQDTFLKAVRYAERADKQGNQRALLYRIARNVCIDLARKKRAGALPEDLPVEDAGLLHAEADADLMLLLGGLPPDKRELLLLRFQQDLTLREIAEVLGLPLRTVQSRLRAALKAIGQELGREDGRIG